MSDESDQDQDQGVSGRRAAAPASPGAEPGPTPRPGRDAAVLPVRGAELPVGGIETAAQTGGRVWLVGPDPEAALPHLAGVATEVWLIKLGPFEVRTWAASLAANVSDDTGHLLLPHSPDGRDLAPHLALALNRPLVSGATEMTVDRAAVAHHGGTTMATLALDGPVVATFQAGARTHPHPDPDLAMTVERPPTPLASIRPDTGPGGRTELVAELPADPTTVDLAEATRIVGAGAGLGSPEAVGALEAVAAGLSASVGATRVVTDWGWVNAERQIGTTGVTVDPDLYLAVGISGAIQHTAGLGSPEHTIVVNTDASCPMMDLADLGLVCDGPAFLAALLTALERRTTT